MNNTFVKGDNSVYVYKPYDNVATLEILDKLIRRRYNRIEQMISFHRTALRISH